MLYAADAVPLIRRSDDVRPIAKRIDALIPAGKELVLYDPGWQPAIFYLRTQYRYAPVLERIPHDAEFILARRAAEKRLREKRPDLAVVRRIPGKGPGEELLLLQPLARIPKDADPAAETQRQTP
jgi:hypothetical protein